MRRLSVSLPFHWSLCMLPAVVACAVPSPGESSGEGGPAAGKADGESSGCVVELASIANQPTDELDCDYDDCDYELHAYVDVDEALSEEGWEPVLSYRQRKDGGCIFFCEEDGEPGYIDGEVEAWEQVERDVPAGKDRYKLFWRFHTTSNEPIEVSTKLVRGDDEQSGASYELIPGRGFEQTGACAAAAVPCENVEHEDAQQACKVLEDIPAYQELRDSDSVAHRQLADALRRLMIQPRNTLSKGARGVLATLVASKDDDLAAITTDELRTLPYVPWDFTSCEPGVWPPCLGVLPNLAQVTAPTQAPTPPEPLDHDIVRADPVVQPRIEPEIRNPAEYQEKVNTLVAEEPVEFDESDFIANEVPAAKFHVLVQESEECWNEVAVTSPLDDGSVPAENRNLTFPGDRDSVRLDLGLSEAEAEDPANWVELYQKSIAQTAKAIARVPDVVRDVVQQIDLMDRRSFLDEPFGNAYGRPAGEGHENALRAYMSALVFPARHLGVFPMPHDPTPNDDEPLGYQAPAAKSMHETISHEAGHLLTYWAWGQNPGSPGWQRWQDARVKDVITVSTYAQSSILEDSAETFLVYFLVQQSGDAALMDEFRALMPNRWAAMEDVLQDFEAETPPSCWE